MQKNNVISIIKHFPGHGITKKDSHILLPYTFNYKEVLKENMIKKILIRQEPPSLKEASLSNENFLFLFNPFQKADVVSSQ